MRLSAAFCVAICTIWSHDGKICPLCLQGWKPAVFALVGLGGGVMFLVLFARQLRTETQRYKRD